MTIFEIHPVSPQARLVSRVAAIVRNGGVIVYPTDSSYAIGCHPGNKSAIEKIRKIRKLDNQHQFTLICRNMSELAEYGKVSNQAFRMIKMLTPGPYTFVLSASREVPRRLLHKKRKTIGLRIPDNQVALSLIGAIGEPLMSATMILPDSPLPLHDPYVIPDFVANQLDAIVAAGPSMHEPSTVIDLVNDKPTVIRQGIGDTSFLEY